MPPEAHPDTPFAQWLQHFIKFNYPEQKVLADILRLTEPTLSSYKVGRRAPTPGLLRRFKQYLPDRHPDALRAYIRQRGGVNLPIEPSHHEKERLGYALLNCWDDLSPHSAKKIADFILLGRALGGRY